MRARLALLPLTIAVLAREPAARGADATAMRCIAANEASIQASDAHKLRAAREQLLICAAAACPNDVRGECVPRVAEINAAIPTIVFSAKDDSSNDLRAVTVTMDGELLARELGGAALAVDPGEHTFLFKTPGYPAVQKTLLIREGQKERAELVTFGGPVAASAITLVEPGTTKTEGPVRAPSRGLSTQRVLAIVAGGVGVAGLGVGAAFGIAALSKKSAADAICSNDQCSNQTGVDDSKTATTLGNVSTLGCVVGALAIAGSVTLWLTAPRGAAPRVGVGPRSVEMKWAW